MSHPLCQCLRLRIGLCPDLLLQSLGELFVAFQGAGPVSGENQASHHDPESELGAGIQGECPCRHGGGFLGLAGAEQVFGVPGENLDAARPNGRPLAGQPILEVGRPGD